MTNITLEPLAARHCANCAEEAERISASDAAEQLKALPGWELKKGREIRKEWTAKDFSSGLAFLDEVGKIAEEEGHHPDVCLKGYKRVGVVLSTHSIGGVSENDFIMAAKIEQLAASLHLGA
jgi:4a-hydroxytetrahydrobiopterin dehydratase